MDKFFFTIDEEFFKRDDPPAIKLTKEAEKKVLEIYHVFFDKLVKNPELIGYIIVDKIFIKILNDCVILSLQKIEERPIKAKLIIPNRYYELREWPQGINFFKIENNTENLTFPHLDLKKLKKYLEISGAPNTYLIIQPIPYGKTNENQESTLYSLFFLKGFLFIEKSLKSFIINYKKSKIHLLSINDKRKALGPLNGSLIFSIDNGKVIVSHLNNRILEVEKGKISYNQSIDDNIYRIIQKSVNLIESYNCFKDINKDLLKEPELFLDKEDNKIKDYSILYRITQSLKTIIYKISEDRHGSTLIFGFNGNLDNETKFQSGAIKISTLYGSKFSEFTNPSKFIENSQDQELISKIEMIENAIISLSKTDGSMIFNQNLDLLSTGTFLISKSSETEEGGSRLKFAKGFVKENKGTIGVVISQDGDITFLPELK